MQKLCIECGVPFKGRSDKKFCSDFCRNHYNNKLNGFTNNYVRRINGILRKNRRILEKYYAGNRFEMDRERLIWEGFDFRYFTHGSKADDGNMYYYCYDYGYSMVNCDSCVLINQGTVQD